MLNISMIILFGKYIESEFVLKKYIESGNSFFSYAAYAMIVLHYTVDNDILRWGGSQNQCHNCAKYILLWIHITLPGWKKLL